MRKLVLVGAVVLTFAAVPAVSNAAGPHKCGASSGSQSTLKIQNGNCDLARKMDRFVATHETLDGDFYAFHREWLGTVLSRPHNSTAMEFVSPGNPFVVIWITVPYPST
jgi:hypothetical protein